MRRVEDVTSLDGYDAVVLGSSVYAGHWLRRARVFVDAFEAELSGGPCGSSPAGRWATRRKPLENPAEVAALVKRLGSRSHRLFGGRIEGDELGSRRRHWWPWCGPPTVTTGPGRRSRSGRRPSPQSCRRRSRPRLTRHRALSAGVYSRSRALIFSTRATCRPPSKRAGQERLHAADGDLRAHDARAHGHHVGIVVLARQAGRDRLRGLDAADAPDLVGHDLLTRAAAAEDEAEAAVARGHGARGRGHVVGIVHALRRCRRRSRRPRSRARAASRRRARLSGRPA